MEAKINANDNTAVDTHTLTHISTQTGLPYIVECPNVECYAFFALLLSLFLHCPLALHVATVPLSCDCMPNPITQWQPAVRPLKGKLATATKCMIFVDDS